MDGPASADPPALAQRAGGTALAKVEPEELSYSPVSSPAQDCPLEVIHCRRHAVPGNIESVCPERAGDYGAGLRDIIAELGPKGASRGVRALLIVIHRLVAAAISGDAARHRHRASYFASYRSPR